jgi:hypothetical protein
MLLRRGLFGSTALVSTSGISGCVRSASIPEESTMDKLTSRPPLYRASAAEMEMPLPKVVP